MKGGKKGNGEGEGCESWVDWYGEVVCDQESLREVVERDVRVAGEDSGSGSHG